MITIPEHVTRFINQQYISNKSEQECLKVMLENTEFSVYSYGTLANYIALYFARM